MQSSSVFHFFPAPSPSGSISTDSHSTGDTAVYGDAAAAATDMYAQQLLQSPPQQLQLQLHELQLLVRPQSQLERVGALLLEAPHGADLGSGDGRGSGTWSNRNKNASGSGSSSNSNNAGNNTPRSIRRRISRACDQCNQLRTKCDGQHPCVHCVDAGLVCAYIRARKKRGKASRRELALQLAEAAPAPVRGGDSRDGGWPVAQGAPPSHGLDDMVGLDNLGHLSHLADLDMDSLDGLAHLGDLTDLADLASPVHGLSRPPPPNAIDLNGFDVRGHRTAPHGGSEPSQHGTPFATPPSPPPLPQPLRYPVLTPLLPHLAGIVSAPAACDLVDAYFTRADSSSAAPQSPQEEEDPLLARLPFALDLVVRRRAVLHPTAPRPCRPALLASMLWIAATTDDGGGKDSHAALCASLRALVVDLLPPPLAPHHQAVPTADPLPPSVDDVVACIHLASCAAGEDGLPWWHAAWSLARRLQLGREQPGCGGQIDTNSDDAEACEERRRVWWLAYMADRHLALRWRRPLFLLDAECADLRLPVADAVWKEEEDDAHDAHDTHDGACGPPIAASNGPSGLYSTLLPLMVLVGETVDLLHARSHPLLGSRCGGHDDAPWDVHATARITQHLAVYEQSLETGDDNAATAYATYAVHMVRVLRDLLARGWDAAATASLSVLPMGGRAGDLGVKSE